MSHTLQRAWLISFSGLADENWTRCTSKNLNLRFLLSYFDSIAIYAWRYSISFFFLNIFWNCNYLKITSWIVSLQFLDKEAYNLLHSRSNKFFRFERYDNKWSHLHYGPIIGSTVLGHFTVGDWLVFADY